MRTAGFPDRDFNPVRDARGFGLVEVMVSASILAMVALGMTSFMSRMTQNQLSQRLVATRDNIKQKLESYGRSGAVLWQITLNTNATVVAANGVAAGYNDCAKNKNCGVGTANQKGFYFVDPTGVILGGPVNTAYFTADGSACAGPTANNCYLMVETDVYTTTPGCAAPTCATSTTMTIYYSITQTANNANVSLKATTGTITVSLPITATSGGTGTVSAGTPNYFSKYDATGTTLVQSAKVYETAAGFIGIGTTAPVAEFHLLKSADSNVEFRIENKNTSANAGLQFTIANDVSGAGIGMSSSGSSVNWGAIKPNTTFFNSTSPLVISTDSPTAVLKFATGDATNAPIEHMRIDNAGNVGIGTSTPSSMLSVNGTADKAGGGSWGTYSDGRLKDIEGPFEYGLDEVLSLKPIWYHYKHSNPIGLPSNKTYSGFIAQDVQKVIPEAVQKTGKGYLTLNQDPILWAMLNAIKSLYQKLTTVLTTVTDLKNSSELASDKLQNRINQLEAENRQLKAYLCSKDPTADFCASK